MNSQQYLRPTTAAEFLHSHFGFGSRRTLAKLRVIGGGPVFRKAGRLVLYTPDDLLAWGNAKLSEPRRSTSDERKV